MLAALVAVGLLGAVQQHLRSAPQPERCGEGYLPLGPRCCPSGASLDPEQRCVGVPAAAASGGLPRERVRIEGGRLVLGPSDWEAQGVVQPRLIEVGAFWLDRHEVSAAWLGRCVEQGGCEGPAPRDDGQRAARMSLAQAERFCRWAGGRLPRDDEWGFAAMSGRGRRYPWGDTGAVCRRAAFGLASGPCARGALGPDTIGARPDGSSPEGLVDLAGNVAEWTTDPPRRRGGSYRSSLAAELRGWSGQDGRDGLDDGATGARCAYDAPLIWRRWSLFFVLQVAAPKKLPSSVP